MNGTETYLFAGGGSGGHLFPGIAVADELRRRNPLARIVFVGSERPVEQRILQPTGYEHHALPVESLAELRRFPPRFLWRNWSAWRAARQIVSFTRPRGVVGLGGFASAPTVWAARRLGIPVVLIEQNVIPGAATRWLVGCATTICLTFEETRSRLPGKAKTVITGNPLRAEILRAAERRTAWDNVHRDRPRTLLILGGSQGAESLNEAVILWITRESSTFENWRIVHQTGPGRGAAIRDRYATLRLNATVDEFFPDVAEHYVSADLVLSRAGATTLSELAVMGCPSVLVPYPFAADQHQAANAEVFARQGAAVLLRQADSAVEMADRLRDPLRNLMTNDCQRAAMRQAALRLARPDAAWQIAELLLRRTGRSQLPAEALSERTDRLAHHIV